MERGETYGESPRIPVFVIRLVTLLPWGHRSNLGRQLELHKLPIGASTLVEIEVIRKG